MAGEEGRQKRGREADGPGDRRHKAVAEPNIFSLKLFSVHLGWRLMGIAYVIGLEISYFHLDRTTE